MSRLRLIACLLALATVAIFMPAVWFDFVNFDDNEYITNNPPVRHGLTLAGVAWAITAFHAGNWHPLTWLSHMADCEFFALNAGGHHLVNVLFHAANTALLFILLCQLTRKVGPAACVAALFAWHPIHVESVAWISERKDVLSTFFALLTMLSYVKYTAALSAGNARSRLFYVTSLGCFALGLMSKPMLVTLPCLLLLLDVWPLKRFTFGTIRRGFMQEKIPFFILTVFICLITLAAQHSGNALASLTQIPLTQRIATAMVSLVGYIKNFFWPTDLCALYLLPVTIPASQICLAASVLLAISVLAWIWRNERPYFLLGWLWFLGTLVPVSGLVQVGGQAMADRYTYIPSMGFFLAVVFLTNEFADRYRIPLPFRSATAILIAFACIALTEKQLPSWRNGEALFRRAIAVNPTNDVALVDLGVTLAAHGHLEAAVNAYRQAEQLGSHRFQLHNNLGNALGYLDRHEESLAEYRLALELAPGNATVHYAVGKQLAALNRWEEALAEYVEAGRLNPHYPAPCLEAGKLLFKLGRDHDGLTTFSAAVQMDGGNFQTLATAAHYLAANENAAARDGSNAVRLALKADELSGHNQPMVLDILGMAYAETSDFTNAAICARNALDFAKTAQLKETAALQIRWELYQRQQPWHESFRATNIPAGK